MAERIIFNAVALGLFLFLFFRMIQKNDTNYIYILGVQALGIAIAFFGLITRIELPIVLIIFTYIFSIILPIIVILIERKGISLTEAIYITLSKIYIKKEDETKARNAVLKLIEKNPNSYYGHKFLGELYEKEGKLETATEEYMRASSIKPEDKQIQFKIADLFNKTERKDDAIKVLHSLLKSNPEWQDATMLLGDILQEQEKFKEAVNVYLDALNYNPDNYELYYNLGIVYTRLNDFQSAKEYYEKAAKLNSLLYHAKYSLGQIALIYNELDEAQMYFEECLQDEELEEDAYFYLAYISMLKGEEEKAITYLNTAVGEDPEMYDRIRKELIFKLIFNKIDKPNKNKEPKKRPKTKITKKERKTIEHLRHTYELVGNLNNNDIKAMRIIKTKREEDGKKDIIIEEDKNIIK